MLRRPRVLLALLSVALAVPACRTTGETAQAEGWRTLIDAGKGLDRFDRIGTANWGERDGSLQADRALEDQAYLVSRESYRDFDLHLEFWASEDANSGVFLRCADPRRIGPDTCYEVNVWDRRPDPSYGTGAIVNVAPVDPMPKAGGRWNAFDISAVGRRLVVVFNGRKTVDVEDGRLANGPIALQWRGGTVRFRTVRLRTR